MFWDAIRKVITLSARLSEEHGQTHWRQSQYNLKQIKKGYRKAQKIKHSTSKDETKRSAQQEAIKQAHKDYLQHAQELLTKAKHTLTSIEIKSSIDWLKILEIERYISHAQRQIEQINRRVINEEKIPHHEKVFSLFQEHTEWISKGKAGVPVELGLKTCVLEDQYGFILHHQVMQQQTDNQIAIDMVAQTCKRFPAMKSCSFDKGFHSPANQEGLKAQLELVVLPKKGRRNEKEKAREHGAAFQAARRQHSAVESAINALEVHGLDICPLAVVARNMQKLGAELRKLEKPDRQRKHAA